MAFGVRKFPDSLDPRGTAFCVEGFAWGAVPAYRYTLSTTGALAPFDLLNAGVTIDFVGGVFGFHEWILFSAEPGTPTYTLAIEGHEVQIVGPPDWSIDWQIILQAPLVVDHIGDVHALFPDAITGWPTVAVAPVLPVANLVPNPIVITPRPYDWPLST